MDEYTFKLSVPLYRILMQGSCGTGFGGYLTILYFSNNKCSRLMHLLTGIVQIVQIMNKWLTEEAGTSGLSCTSSALQWHWLMPDASWSKYTTF